MKLGKWSKQIRKRGNWKETTSYVTNNKELYMFLEDNGYKDKSKLDSDKIINLIPKSLVNYFWKGYIDGDGSIGKCGRGSFFEISSSYDYSYESIKKLFKELNINKFNVYKSINKENHKHSAIKVYGKEILKLKSIFIDYGLLRKTNKFLTIEEKYK